MLDYQAIIYNNIFNAIVKNVDIKPGEAFNTSGSTYIGNGLKMHVYSDDHGTHFHVRFQDEIDARFSYPDIALEDYVSERQFKSRQLKNIINTCTNNRIFNSFIAEQLAKRTQ